MYTLKIIMDGNENNFSISQDHRRVLCEDGLSSNYYLFLKEKKTVKIHVVGEDQETFDGYDIFLMTTLYNSERNGMELTVESNSELNRCVAILTREGRREIGGWVNII